MLSESTANGKSHKNLCDCLAEPDESDFFFNESASDFASLNSLLSYESNINSRVSPLEGTRYLLEHFRLRNQKDHPLNPLIHIRG